MTEQRCAVVAVLGAPNAGKSTLVNTLVGAKVAAVTQKVQTTRALVRGIAMRGETQLVLIDTPGVFAPKRRLERARGGGRHHPCGGRARARERGAHRRRCAGGGGFRGDRSEVEGDGAGV